MFDFYMVEHIWISYVPTITRLEQTSTTVRDTAIWPTTHAIDPDNSSYSPITTSAAWDAVRSYLLSYSK